MDRNKILPLAMVVIGSGYLISRFMPVAARASVREVVVHRRPRAEIEPFEMYPQGPIRVIRASEGWEPVKIHHTDDGALKERVPTPKKKPENKRPKLFDVRLQNDDYTSQEFVVEILKKHFNRSAEDAYLVMMDVHTKGSAIANDQPLQWEIADDRKTTVMDEAKKRDMPFLVELVPL